jgi:hypothetical protein
MTPTSATKAPAPTSYEDIDAIYQRLREASAKLIGPHGKTQVLPNNAHSFLCQLLADLTAGSAVTILQDNALLTTIDVMAAGAEG